MGAVKLGKSQLKLYQLLTTQTGKSFTFNEIIKRTGYKKDSFSVLLGSGRYSDYLQSLKSGKFKVTAAPSLSKKEFQRQTSQSKKKQVLAGSFKNPLARKLIQKSKENFILALELYNRPSLENRHEGFALLFCTAFDQLLKAEIVEAKGDEAIFKAAKNGRPRETISFAKTVEEIYPKSTSKIRQNLEVIIELRNRATHLLMPELAQPVSRFFQSGVLNYVKRFTSTVGEAILPTSSAGLLTLVARVDAQTSAIELKQLYGALAAKDIEELCAMLNQKIVSGNSAELAIPLDYKMVLSKDASESDITVSIGQDPSRSVTFVDRFKDPSKSHPLKTGAATEAIAKRLNQKFTTYDFQAIVKREKIKGSNNEFHYEWLHNHAYSTKFVDVVVGKIEADSAYWPKARESYRRWLRKKANNA